MGLPDTFRAVIVGYGKFPQELAVEIKKSHPQAHVTTWTPGSRWDVHERQSDVVILTSHDLGVCKAIEVIREYPDWSFVVGVDKETRAIYEGLPHVRLAHSSMPRDWVVEMVMALPSPAPANASA